MLKAMIARLFTAAVLITPVMPDAGGRDRTARGFLDLSALVGGRNA